MKSKKLSKNDKEQLKELITEDVEVKKKTGRPAKKNYINPEEFKNQIVQFYKDSVVTDELGKSIFDIANRMAFRPNFINYNYKEEMVGDALIKMMEALHNKKYDPERGNAFSYYSQITFNAFCNRIKKEKKNRETLSNYQDDVYQVLISNGLIAPDKDQHITEEHHDYIKE